MSVLEGRLEKENDNWQGCQKKKTKQKNMFFQT